MIEDSDMANLAHAAAAGQRALLACPSRRWTRRIDARRSARTWQTSGRMLSGVPGRVVSCLVVLAACMAVLSGSEASAASSGNALELYAVPSSGAMWDGSARPFLCLLDAEAGRRCYAFFPRLSGLARIRLSDGHVLAREGADWTETPGGFRFRIGHIDNSGIALVDKTRDVTWYLPLSGGHSTLIMGKAAQAWSDVTGVGYAANTPFFIGGAGLSDRDLVRYPALPVTVPVERLHVSAAQWQAILTSFDAWNHHNLQDQSHDPRKLIEQVARLAGLPAARASALAAKMFATRIEADRHVLDLPPATGGDGRP